MIRSLCVLLLLLSLNAADVGAVDHAQGKKKAPPASEAKKEAADTISRDPYIGAIVVDAKDGTVLFGDNPDAAGYPASVVKLMNLLILQERIAQGHLRLDEQVTVTAEAAKMGGTQVYLKESEVFPVEELIYAMMVESANDAATALAVHVAGSKQGFIELMNRKAKELGMNATSFASVHGLPPSKGQPHDRTTPRDLATLSRALLQYPDTINYTSTRERPFREGSFTLRSHNHLLGSFPGADGLKTGFIRAGGYNIAVTAQRGGARVIAVVMGSATRVVRDRHATDLLSKGLLKIAPQQSAPSLPPKVLPSPATAAAPAAGPQKTAAAVEAVKASVVAPASPAPAATPSEGSKNGAQTTASKTSLNWPLVLMVGGGVLAGLLIGLFIATGRGMFRRR
ncbi:MAG: hypothetical protein BWK76_20875 [Desulfobulbaceae bacterium A2]|nr:MAG: hypothetical protein BWK76_20875 [Desulfobulbaceae bacterium A2]